ncbi:glycosyltransferase family 1 protein [Paenibacillus sp. sgz302251]|uniref:glycosyltransferase family 1 protein n=1 Tax=Paenibacillus sp. sgz302251 TaxID=3414493 RepID=UPI003C7D1872
MIHRVLHVVSAMNRGGAETLLMNVYRNIDRSKVQFDFVSHRMESCDYDDEIISLGGRIYRIHSFGQQGPIAYLNELKKIMSQTNYVAVHSHTDYQSGFAALAGKMAGIKKRICHSHSNNWGRGNGLKASMMFKVLQTVIHYAATDYCACSVEAARFLFGSSLTDSGKTFVMKNGIEIGRFVNIEASVQLDIKQELNIASESKIIGHVGTFSPSKNHTFLLKVLKQMIDEEKDVIAVLVGDGALRSSIEAEARRMGIFNRIRFLGVRVDIPKLMKSFDVFVFPSVFEGFGIVTVEAQCSGTPCVAADTVPKVTDMGVGLMSFISLDESLEAWSQQINMALFMKKPDQNTILNKIASQGFDIRDSIHDWLDLYGVS